MTNSQRLAASRERLRGWLAQQSGEARSESVAAEIVGESILIVDGFYCGRRFDAGSYFAIWFMEEDELKIHAAGGELLCVFAGEEITHVHQCEAPAAEQAPFEGEIRDVIPLTESDDDQWDDDIRRAA